MSAPRNIILVAWDFTIAGENALEHAIRISTHTRYKIRLLHVMKKNSGILARSKAESKCQAVCKKTSDRYNVLVDYFIVEGNLFEKITPYAESNKIGIVVMGTHGIKGMQKWFGSRAMKVISGSKIPFIVVQDKPKSQDELSHVIFPLNGNPHEMEKVSWTTFIAKYLHSKVHLLQLDEEQNQNKIKLNLTLSLKKFLKNNISYTVYQAERNKELSVSTLSLARELNAELIVWLSKSHKRSNYFFDKEEERIIANQEKIPVMYIHPGSELNAPT